MLAVGKKDKCNCYDYLCLKTWYNNNDVRISLLNVYGSSNMITFYSEENQMAKLWRKILYTMDSHNYKLQEIRFYKLPQTTNKMVVHRLLWKCYVLRKGGGNNIKKDELIAFSFYFYIIQLPMSNFIPFRGSASQSRHFWSVSHEEVYSGYEPAGIT